MLADAACGRALIIRRFRLLLRLNLFTPVRSPVPIRGCILLQRGVACLLLYSQIHDLCPGTVPPGDFAFAVRVVSGSLVVGPSVNRAMSGGCRAGQHYQRNYQQTFHVSLTPPTCTRRCVSTALLQLKPACHCRPILSLHNQRKVKTRIVSPRQWNGAKRPACPRSAHLFSNPLFRFIEWLQQLSLSGCSFPAIRAFQPEYHYPAGSGRQLNREKSPVEPDHFCMLHSPPFPSKFLT